VIDPTSGTLFLNVAIPRTDSGAAPALTGSVDWSGSVGALVSVRIDSLAIGGFPLDESVNGLGVIGSWVYALHAGTSGDVTFVPIATLERTKAHRVKGFLATQLLDRGEEVSP
jgi:hypothetical protein